MGFPENVLTPGEQVALDLHPHPMTVAVPAVLGVVLVGVAEAVAYVTPDDATGNRIQWIAVIVIVLAAIPLVLFPFLAWRTTHYVVTTHRVMVRKGILSKSGKDITLSKITDVSFHQSLLDRLIRSGTLNIESAGDSPNEQFRNIPRSNLVQQLINQLVDEDANRRSMVIQERLAVRAEGHDGGGPAHSAPAAARADSPSVAPADPTVPVRYPADPADPAEGAQPRG